MNLSNYLANRLSEVLTDGKWVTGTNFKEQILNLDWKIATKKVYTLNSIADLTFHINYYITGVTKVLQGGTLDIRDAHSFDYPGINSKKEWDEMGTKFSNDSKIFINLVEKMTSEKLFKNFVDEKYGNYYRNIDVMIEHTYYHLGQILLIKKIIRNLQ